MMPYKDKRQYSLYQYFHRRDPNVKNARNKKLRDEVYCTDEYRTYIRELHKTEKYRMRAKNRAIIRNAKRRKLVFQYYGEKCACCGEPNVEFLTIDHITPCGKANRKHNFYKWLIDNNYPEGFQSLCWNCNLGKQIYGTCPHQLHKNGSGI